MGEGYSDIRGYYVLSTGEKVSASSPGAYKKAKKDASRRRSGGGGRSSPSSYPPPTTLPVKPPKPIKVEEPEPVTQPTSTIEPTKKIIIPREYATVTRRVSPQETAYIPPTEPFIKEERRPEAAGVLTTSPHGPGRYFKPVTRTDAITKTETKPIETVFSIPSKTSKLEQPKRFFSGQETTSTEETAFRKSQEKETFVDAYRKGISVLAPTGHEPDTFTTSFKSFTHRLASAPVDVLEAPRILEGRSTLGDIMKIPGEAVTAGITYAQKKPYEAGGALLADIALGFGLTKAYRYVKPQYKVTALTGISTEYQETRFGVRQLKKPTTEPSTIKYAAKAQVDATPMIKTYTPTELQKTRSLTTIKSIQETTPDSSRIIARTTTERIVPETFTYTTKKKPTIQGGIDIFEPFEARALESVSIGRSGEQLAARRTTTYSRGYPIDLTPEMGEFRITRYRGRGSDVIKPFSRGEPTRGVSATGRARADILGRGTRPRTGVKVKGKTKPTETYKRTTIPIGYGVDYAYEPAAMISPRAAGRVLEKEMGYPSGPQLGTKDVLGSGIKTERYTRGISRVEPTVALKPKLGERLVFSRGSGLDFRSELKQRPSQRDIIGERFGEITVPAMRQDIKPITKLERKPELRYKQKPITRQRSAPSPYIRPGTFGMRTPTPGISQPLLPERRTSFKSPKKKLIDKKLRPGYSPSLLGMMSGKTIKKKPKRVLTGVGIRYPVR